LIRKVFVKEKKMKKKKLDITKIMKKKKIKASLANHQKLSGIPKKQFGMT
jgi:hypothetical protein